MIEVIDNVFDEKTIDFLYGYYRDQSPWHFTGEGIDNSNWRKFYKDLSQDSKKDNILFYKAEEIFNSKLPHLKKTHTLDRPYVSGYVYGTHHDMHIDGDCYTIMFYLNKVWAIPYAGETIFTNHEQTEILSSVIPKPGRVVVFDGQIPHCAREVSRTCVELRMVATFKYYKKEDNGHQ
jgi:hypothetical protein